MPANAVVDLGTNRFFLDRQVVHALSLQNIDVVKATQKLVSMCVAAKHGAITSIYYVKITPH